MRTKPDVGTLFTAWQPQPLAILMVVVLAAGYLVGLRALRRRSVPWPRWRSAVFGAGIVFLAWSSNGFPNAYRDALYWVWVSQTLILWLLVPLLLLGGGALHLALAVGGPDSAIARAMGSAPVRTLSNPLIGPALVPLLSAVLFFGPLPRWAIVYPVLGWVIHLVLVLIGAAMVLPLVGPEEDVPSLAVGLALGVGMVELVLDAIPGIVLRLHQSLVTGYFDHRATYPWTPSAVNDQHVAGSVVWVIAEIIDLPFLLMVFRRWIRADARDAARIDAVLDAERIARGSELPSGTAEPGPMAGSRGAIVVDGELGPADRPWWETDAELGKRVRHDQRR